jgi:hypothetical protein
MASEKYVLTSQQRRVSSILKPRIFRMFIADMIINSREKGELSAHIISKYYDGLTDVKQKELLSHYDKVKIIPKPI